MAKKKRHRFKEPFSRGTLILIQTIGSGKTLELSKKFGGRRIYLPKLSTFDTEYYRSKIKNNLVGPLIAKVIEILGLNVTRNLCQLIGGDRVRIPSMERIRLFVRTEKMIKDFNGSNFAEVARKYNLSVRHTQRIISQHKKGREKMVRRRRRIKHKRS